MSVYALQPCTLEDHPRTISFNQGTGDRIPPQLQLQVAQAMKLFSHIGLVLDGGHDNDIVED